jgi:site-specific recombinase XerD
MLEKSFSLLFYLKKPKNYLKGALPIYLRITVDGIPKEISTGRQCDPDRWNSNAGRVYGTKEDVKALNTYLDTLQTKVHEARLRLIEKNESINSDALKCILKGKKDKSKMILVIFQLHNEQMKSLVGKDFSPATLERYKTSLQHTQSFIMWKYGENDIDIRQLDYEFVSQYEFWLKTIRNCRHNTAIKYIANFRKIVNRCIRTGWLEKDPFVGFKMTKKEVVPEYLTQHELETMTTKKFNNERLRQVRDIFVFCCYTGLAFADVKKLNTSEIGVGIDGSKWIFTSRQKTDTTSKIPLLPISLEIIERYKNHPVCLNAERLLPVLSNQKYNEYLKEIANLCRINKQMTTHTARHTFATTVTLSNGVPIESVSKMLGHKNLKTTQHYARVLDKKISEDMNTLRTKLEAKGSENLKAI